MSSRSPGVPPSTMAVLKNSGKLRNGQNRIDSSHVDTMVQPDLFLIDDNENERILKGMQQRVWDSGADSPVGTTLREPRLLSRYNFRPLTGSSEIRLLRLPSQDSFSIDAFRHKFPEVEIVHARLDEKPVYETLSYTWGELSDGCPVFLTEGRFLNVTLDLHRALRRFCPSTGERLLWVDQLCINQHDLAERSQQVRLMFNIFRQAVRTNVWLGEEPDSSIAVYKDVMAYARSRPDASTEANNPSSAKASRALAPATWQFMTGNFFTLPWFTRLWVFQEIIVSQEIRITCGSMQCSWDDLVRAARMTGSALQQNSQGQTNVHIMFCFRTMHQSQATDLHLLHLLLDTAPCFECRDPRDKVFALLSIKPPPTDPTSIVDYTTPTADVYTALARDMITSSASLHLWAGIVSPPAARLPSWVPDWTRRTTAPGIEMVTNIKFSASRTYPHTNPPSPSGSKPKSTRLLVRGKAIAYIDGVVEHAFETHPFHTRTQNITAFFPHTALLAAILSRFYPTTTTPSVSLATKTALMTTLMRTVIADGVLRVESPKRRTSAAEIAALWDALLSPSHVSSPPSVLPPPPQIDPVGQEYPPRPHHQQYHQEDEEEEEEEEEEKEEEKQNQKQRQRQQDQDRERQRLRTQFIAQASVCAHRRIVLLDGYRIALAPKTARPFDVVCVLHGATVPCLLRRVQAGQQEAKGKEGEGKTEREEEEKEEEYELLGQCFVDGVMYGEGVDWAEDEARWFTLV
ncbi:hypothetical protein MMC19_002294 [Ptychographa xylographoides]|nr:hypothetical protein [Ptychographa xylographoides]